MERWRISNGDVQSEGCAFVCSGQNECPNGEDEMPGGLDCSEYERPYPELGGFKCDHAWAEHETKLCLHMSGMCNGLEVCVAGQDEEDCEESTTTFLLSSCHSR